MEVEIAFTEKEQLVEQVRNSLPDGNFGDVMIVGGGISGIRLRKVAECGNQP